MNRASLIWTLCLAACSTAPTPDEDGTAPPVDGDAAIDADSDRGLCDDANVRATVDGTPMGGLKDALAAAVSGSVVTVCAGTHEGPFVATVPVSLSSTDGPEATILTVADGVEGRVLSLPADSTLTGFTLTGGDTPELGGGLLLSSSGALAVADCVVSDNRAQEGGGIAIPSGASVTLDDTVISGNQAEQGGGLLVSEGATVVLTATVVHSNAASSGGGLYAIDGQIVGGRIERNRAVDLGGGVYASGSTLDGLTVVGNDCLPPTGFGSGGGLYLAHSTLLNGLVTDNRAGGGGGIELGPDGVVDSSVVEANEAIRSGGGISVVDSLSAAIRDTEIVGNRAGGGGGLYVMAGTLDVTGGSVLQNEASGSTSSGAFVNVDGVLNSANVDWGVGIDDNLTADVFLYQIPYWSDYTGYGASATFSCTVLTCSPEP